MTMPKADMAPEIDNTVKMAEVLHSCKPFRTSLLHEECPEVTDRSIHSCTFSPLSGSCLFLHFPLLVFLFFLYVFPFIFLF